MNDSNNKIQAKPYASKSAELSAEKPSELPRFQQLQAAMTQAIRHPELGYQVADGVDGAKVNAIENRRINIYQSLFYNNVEAFFSQIFPVCRSMFSDDAWESMVRKYLQEHHASTPLFHKLGLEFLRFIEAQLDEGWLHELLKPMTADNFLQLAHYEWVELELSLVEKVKKVSSIHEYATNNDALKQYQTGTAEYRLADAVWPLYYEYALQSIQPPLSKHEKQDTFLLAQRVDKAESKKQIVEFHELTASMYALLMSFQKAEWQVSSKADFSYENAVIPHYIDLASVSKELSEDFAMAEEELTAWLQEILPSLLDNGWLMKRMANEKS